MWVYSGGRMPFAFVPFLTMRKSKLAHHRGSNLRDQSLGVGIAAPGAKQAVGYWGLCMAITQGELLILQNADLEHSNYKQFLIVFNRFQNFPELIKKK